MSIKKEYISPIYSPISLDETSSLVLLSPPSDKSEDTDWWASGDMGDQGQQKISPFALSDFSVGSSSGTPFDSDSLF